MTSPLCEQSARDPAAKSIEGSLAMSLPPPEFEVVRNIATEQTTKIQVSVRGTVDLENVVIGFIDPAFDDGAQITLPATLLFKLPNGQLAHTERPDSRVVGYQADLFDLAFRNYLDTTKRQSHEVKSYLEAGLRQIAALKYKIRTEEVVLRI
jgi:hypothetical protein